MKLVTWTLIKISSLRGYWRKWRSCSEMSDGEGYFNWLITPLFIKFSTWFFFSVSCTNTVQMLWGSIPYGVHIISSGRSIQTDSNYTFAWTLFIDLFISILILFIYRIIMHALLFMWWWANIKILLFSLTWIWMIALTFSNLVNWKFC